MCKSNLFLYNNLTTNTSTIMKKLLIYTLMVFAFGIQNTNAQNVVREGLTFKSITSSKAKADTLLTDFKFEDSKGVQYPIIINKTSGRCWIWKQSGKTDRMYKQYMSEEISLAVCKELNITYIPKTKKRH